jgi:hypothetical protein
MARYTATLNPSRERATVFAYLSDFSTTREWDPSVREAEHVGDGPIGMGSRFRLVARFLGRDAELTYEIVAYRPEELVTLRGENATVVSLDTMTFSAEPTGGSRLTYDAELTLKGPLRMLDPLLGLAFKRLGDRATDGLRDMLNAAQRGAGREPASAGNGPLGIDVAR